MRSASSWQAQVTHRISTVLREVAIPPQPSPLQAHFRAAILAAGASLAILQLCPAQESVATQVGTPTTEEGSLELSRPVRPWEFLSTTGSRSALLGNESGQMEAWVYPLKILRNFHLQFKVAGRTLPAESLARTVITRPESSTLVYASDDFVVRETFCAPTNEPGAIIVVKVQTSEPLEVRVIFERDFQLEWPAALGGTFENWDANLHAFVFGEERKQFAALVGSPTAGNIEEEYQTNSSMSDENSFSLGVTDKGEATKAVVIAASWKGQVDAQAVYQRLTANYASLEREASDYYRAYLGKTIALKLPDAQLQQAYDWSRTSVLQGLVANPFLGTGFVAGYRTSGTGQRPGFAWFFGRDALWTSFALNSEGDYASARTALEFLSKYQRDDGKVPHEVSQSASLVDWFKDYPYAFASADATPLYIIAMDDYVTQSGDSAFARQKWDNLWKAYQFLVSTYDTQGLPRNFGIGHGWVEGGPLLPVGSEFYQAALGTDALRALSDLAGLLGKGDISQKLSQDFAQHKTLLDRTFWLADKQRFAFAIDKDGRPIDEPTVLSTVPMWFGLLDEHKADAMINQLAGLDHESDWGMRIISSSAPEYSPAGYHYGSVWPLFTGWASAGEYRYHRALPAYSNLRANSLLALDGSLGHVTEVLSGDYYQPLSTSSPHQIWSAAMVVSSFLRGLLGLTTDAIHHKLIFAPHVPADWTSFTVQNVHVGSCVLDMRYQKTETDVTLEVNRRDGDGDCELEFSPAIGFRANVVRTDLDGHAVRHHVVDHEADEHVNVRARLHRGKNVLRVVLRNDFELSINSSLPPFGSQSAGMRVVSESWTPARDRLELTVAGSTARDYELGVSGSSEVTGVDGGDFVKTRGGLGTLRFQISESGAQTGYGQVKLVLHFVAQRKGVQR